MPPFVVNLLYTSLKGLLAPVLLFQGKHVRRHTQRLPEAAGARTGEAGQGPLLRLWLLGDSAVAGVGVQSQYQALSGQLVQALSTHYRLRWQVHAHTGDTLADLTQVAAGLPNESLDVIILAIGVNDVTSQTAPQAWRKNYQDLLNRLQVKHKPALLLLTEVPPLNYFPALPLPLNYWLGLGAQRLNHQLSTLTSPPHTQLVKLSLATQFSAANMASDGFHPSTLGYHAWAQALAQQIRAHFPLETLVSLPSKHEALQ